MEARMYTLRAGPLLILGLVILAGLPLPYAWSLGSEGFSNKDLSEASYTGCPGLWDVINRDSLVYTRWVNGDEIFCYHGGTDKLNDALKAFAAVEVDVHEVILRPGPGSVKTFDGKPIAHDWSVHYVGGLAADALAEKRGTNVSDLHPELTVYVGGEAIAPEDIRFPEAVTITRVGEGPPRFETVFPFEPTHEGRRYFVPDVLPHVRISLVELERKGGFEGTFHLVGELKLPAEFTLEDIPEHLTIRVTFYDERGRLLVQKQSFQTPRASQKWSDENVNESGMRLMYVPQFAFDLDANDVGAKTFRLEVAEARNLEFRPIEQIVNEIGADVLRQAALSTFDRQMKTIEAGQTDVARKFWTEPVCCLDPIRVRSSIAGLRITPPGGPEGRRGLQYGFFPMSITITLRISGGAEEGICISMPPSSFRPTEGRTIDGVTYHRVSDDVFTYTRAAER